MKETDDRLSKIFSRSNDAIFVVDPPRDEILDVNPRACDMLGYTREELLSIGISAVHPEEMPKFLSFANSVYLDQYGWTGELTCLTKTGQVLSTEISASTVELDSRPCIVAIVRDITERKRAEEALRESEERYRSLYQNTPVMMHSIDLNGRLVSVNDHWLKVLGYTRSEVIGRKSIEFLTEASRIYATQVVFAEFFEGGGVTQDIQYQFVKKNGEVLDVLLSFVAERTESGKIYRLSCFIIDVTDKKKAEEAFREAAALAERNRLAREIHDTLAQSLMNMTIQLEMADLLLNKEPEAARKELQSAQHLARECLEEARRSVWELDPGSFDSGGLSVAIQQEVSKASVEGLQVSLNISGEEPALLDRRNRLAVLRITQEALSNIRRHAVAQSAAVRISYGPTAVWLSVSDDGKGFEPSVAQGVLLSTSSGFGLISMQERARLAGGNVEIQSAPDVGTRVEANIPYQWNPGTISDSKKTSAAVNQSQDGVQDIIRILIADDHEMIRRGIRSVLEQTDGFKVVGEAGDGEEAIEQIRTLAPDVLLLDIRMPRLDGVETLRQIRELGLQTRVILLSAYARDEYILDGLRAGARGYLLKDVQRDDLASAIRTVHDGGSLLHPVVAKRLIERMQSKGAADLSAREIEVIQMLASGARNKEIATQLTVTLHTVKYHIENVYRKLEVRTRAEAVRVAGERGLLTS